MRGHGLQPSPLECRVVAVGSTRVPLTPSRAPPPRPRPSSLPATPPAGSTLPLLVGAGQAPVEGGELGEATVGLQGTVAVRASESTPALWFFDSHLRSVPATPEPGVDALSFVDAFELSTGREQQLLAPALGVQRLWLTDMRLEGSVGAPASADAPLNGTKLRLWAKASVGAACVVAGNDAIAGDCLVWRNVEVQSISSAAGALSGSMDEGAVRVDAVLAAFGLPDGSAWHRHGEPLNAVGLAAAELAVTTGSLSVRSTTSAGVAADLAGAVVTVRLGADGYRLGVSVELAGSGGAGQKACTRLAPWGTLAMLTWDAYLAPDLAAVGLADVSLAGASLDAEWRLPVPGAPEIPDELAYFARIDGRGMCLGAQQQQLQLPGNSSTVFLRVSGGLGVAGLGARGGAGVLPVLQAVAKSSESWLSGTVAFNLIDSRATVLVASAPVSRWRWAEEGDLPLVPGGNGVTGGGDTFGWPHARTVASLGTSVHAELELARQCAAGAEGVLCRGLRGLFADSGGDAVLVSSVSGPEAGKQGLLLEASFAAVSLSGGSVEFVDATLALDTRRNVGTPPPVTPKAVLSGTPRIPGLPVALHGTASLGADGTFVMDVSSPSTSAPEAAGRRRRGNLKGSAWEAALGLSLLDVTDVQVHGSVNETQVVTATATFGRGTGPGGSCTTAEATPPGGRCVRVRGALHVAAEQLDDAFVVGVVPAGLTVSQIVRAVGRSLPAMLPLGGVKFEAGTTVSYWTGGDGDPEEVRELPAGVAAELGLDSDATIPAGLGASGTLMAFGSRLQFDLVGAALPDLVTLRLRPPGGELDELSLGRAVQALGVAIPVVGPGIADLLDAAGLGSALVLEEPRLALALAGGPPVVSAFGRPRVFGSSLGHVEVLGGGGVVAIGMAFPAEVLSPLVDGFAGFSVPVISLFAHAGNPPITLVLASKDAPDGVAFASDDLADADIARALTLSAHGSFPDDCGSDVFCKIATSLIPVDLPLLLRATLSNARFKILAAVTDLSLGGGVVLTNVGLFIQVGREGLCVSRYRRHTWSGMHHEVASLARPAIAVGTLSHLLFCFRLLARANLFACVNSGRFVCAVFCRLTAALA